MTDIRDKDIIGHADVVGLNFIHTPSAFVFRRHYRNGLRSHVMEVLDPEAVRLETRGEMVDGVRRFPRSRPVKMLRIFRKKLTRPEEAREENHRLTIIRRHLGLSHIAVSEEFLASYRYDGRFHILLCGLQEYVEGRILDVWNPGAAEELEKCWKSEDSLSPGETFFQRFQKSLTDLVERVKKMIRETGFIPDLAGQGNLLIEATGNVKLVDINNISRLTSCMEIPLDDKGYPACDKSVEALSLMEHRFLGRTVDMKNPVYRLFLDPVRMVEAGDIDAAFHRSIARRI